MSDFFTTIGILVFVMPFTLVLGILASAWRAWWLYPAWTWFLMPLGAPTISFWHFTALSVLLNSFTSHIETKKDERKESMPALIVAFIWPMLLWVMLRWMR